MDKLQNELEQDINKLVGVLKTEEEIKEILKRKLTKKEFKYYKLKIDKIDEDTIAKELNCDKERFEEIKKQTFYKINQEKLKKELTIQ